MARMMEKRWPARGWLTGAITALTVGVCGTAFAGTTPILANETDTFGRFDNYQKEFVAYTNGTMFGNNTTVYVDYALHAEDKVLRGDARTRYLPYQGSVYRSAGGIFPRSGTYKKFAADVQSQTSSMLPEDDRRRGIAMFYRFRARYQEGTTTTWLTFPSTSGTYRQVYNCYGGSETSALVNRIDEMRDWDRSKPFEDEDDDSRGLPDSWTRNVQNVTDGNMMTPHGYMQRARMGMFRANANVINDIFMETENTSPGITTPDGILYEAEPQVFAMYSYATNQWIFNDETQSQYRARVKRNEISPLYRARGYVYTANHSQYPPRFKQHARGSTGNDSCIGSDYWDIHEAAFHFYGDDNGNSESGQDLGAILTPYRLESIQGATVLGQDDYGQACVLGLCSGNVNPPSSQFRYTSNFRIGIGGSATSWHARMWDMHIWDVDSNLSPETAIKKFQPEGESGYHNIGSGFTGGGIYGSAILKGDRSSNFPNVDCDNGSTQSTATGDINNDMASSTRDNTCNKVFMTYDWGW